MRQSLLCLILAWMPLQAQDNIMSGPMIGYTDLREALIWVQTTRPMPVTITYTPEGVENPVTKSMTLNTRTDTYNIAKFVLSYLEAGTVYRYTINADGVAFNPDYPLTFKTQPFYRHRTDPPDFRFGIGSCFFVNEARDDRPGKPYGQDFQILDSLAKEKLDFFIWMGDNVYLREPDFYSRNQLNHRFAHTRAFAGLQPFLASTSHYATWDDHDFGPNDSDRSYPYKDITLDLFSQYFGNPHSGIPGTKGIFFRFGWADVDFIVLDDRYHRAPNRDPDPNKDYLGKSQLQWLKDSLLFSRAPFKIVGNGNQILNTESPFECWCKAKTEWDDFMGWLNDTGIEGVVFISGDRHHTEMLKVEREGNYPLYEFTSSPLTSGAASRLRQVEQDSKLFIPGTRTVGQRNYGVLEVSGPRGSRSLRISTKDVDGKELWNYTITQEELRLPEGHPRKR